MNTRTRPSDGWWRPAIVAGLVVLVGAGGAGCGGVGGEVDLAMADGVDRAEVAATEAGPAALAVGDLGWDLYRELAAGPGGENLVFSPHSIGVALAMARVGAAGTTAEEMDAVLHLREVADPHRSINALDRALVEAAGEVERPDGTTENVEIDIANALWAQDGFGFEEPFLDHLARDYGAGVQLVDYVDDTEGARRTINSWVADRTADRIEELIASGVLSPMTRLVLTNAVYLKAPWETPFDEGATAPGRFTGLDGTTTEVDLMAVDDSFRYARVGDVQAVELPYLGGELAMLVIVPDAGSFARVSSSVDGAFVDDVVGALQPTQLRLRMPGFEFTTQVGLVPVLRSLGMEEAFDPDVADFSAMTTEDRLFVSDVVHEAFIAVDEAGTEAAAATAVVMDLTAAPAEPVELTIDRPFLLAIRHTAAGALLFAGHVVQPG